MSLKRPFVPKSDVKQTFTKIYYWSTLQISDFMSYSHGLICVNNLVGMAMYNVCTTEHTICKHIQVYLLTYGLVQNVLCFLFCYYEASIVIFFSLMICGRLQGLPCK